MSSEVLVYKLPACDVCGDPAVYDAKTKSGPWANLCEKDFKVHGLGKLGTGYGQRLVLKEAGQ